MYQSSWKAVVETETLRDGLQELASLQEYGVSLASPI